MIEVEKLTFSYKEKPVLQDISFRVTAGELVSIIGPNGAGKSTLLKLLDGILPRQNGRIRFHQKEIHQFSRKEFARLVGYVPQHFTSSFNFTALEIVMMGRFPYQGLQPGNSPEDIRAVEEALRETECWELRQRPFLSLSGGERQRVVLASALAQQPEVLLLDEPTTALDLKHQMHFLEILFRLKERQQKTIVMVTHDVNLALRFSDRIFVLKEGRLLARGTAREIGMKPLLEEVYETPLELLYTEEQIPIVFPEMKKI